jgi:NAD kinase
MVRYTHTSVSTSGHLGFLTELELDNMYEGLGEDTVRGNTGKTRRMMLEAYVVIK